MAFLFQSKMLYDFNSEVTSNWQVEDDTVMGGRSSGNFEVTDSGHGRFYGHVSIENNGGFSSVHAIIDRKGVQPNRDIVLHLKGDGSIYQMRIKADAEANYWYKAAFETTGKWQTVTIPIYAFTPVHHGERLSQPNFGHQVIEMIGFLIGNKKEQDFELFIDKIEVI
jgi:hypothetical protein